MILFQTSGGTPQQFAPGTYRFEWPSSDPLAYIALRFARPLAWPDGPCMRCVFTFSDGSVAEMADNQGGAARDKTGAPCAESFYGAPCRYQQDASGQGPVTLLPWPPGAWALDVEILQTLTLGITVEGTV